MPSTPPHLSLLAAMVDELGRSGVEHAVLCPGSRNAPVLLALDAEPSITCWSAVDERSAAFLALGIAKATGRPAAVCVTSGTAISNLLPAATEAHEAGTPLLLLTADRPPELRDVGAGQTIDQLRALGAVTRWVIEADLSEATAERERWVRATACRAVAATLGPGRPGPVQINLPLREPLTAPGGPFEPLVGGREDGAPWLSVSSAAGAARTPVAELAHRLLAAERGVIVAGRAERTPALARLLPRLAAVLGWPLLADPMSGARRGANAIAGYDLFLQADGSIDPALLPSGSASDDPAIAAAQEPPELILRVGDLPVSKPLRAWLAGPAAAAEQVLLTPEAVWADEHSVASEWITGDPLELVRELHGAVAGASEARTEPASGAWLAGWLSLDLAAVSGERARPVLSAGREAPLTEPLVARTLATVLHGEDRLVVGASLAIRMLERWAPVASSPPVVHSNRGANGIDGVTSSAFGVLAALQTAVPQRPHRVVAYLGDLTLLYDQGGLAHAALGLPLQLVVVNNDGGRIFERLAVARNAEPSALEERIVTPQGRDLRHLAAFYDLELHRPTTVGELEAVLALAPDRARLIEVRVP